MTSAILRTIIALLMRSALCAVLLGGPVSASAAVVFQAAGAAVSVPVAGAVNPAWPAHQANDIGLLFIESGGSQAAGPNSNPEWVEVNSFQVDGSPQTTNVSNANGTRLTVYWARATSSSMSAPTINNPGDHVYAQILTYRGAVTSGNPWNVTSAGTKAAASTTVSVTGLTTTVDGALIVQAVSRDNDVAGAAFSALTNASLTSLTERVDDGTTSGNGGGFAVWDGIKATPGVVSATTATVTSSQNAFLSLALRPPPCVTSTVGGSTVVTCNASDTVTMPAGVTSATVEAWGGGGGGDANGNQGGGGGGGGAYASAVVAVVGGSSYNVTVGAGGAAAGAGSLSQFDTGTAVKAAGGASAAAEVGGAGGTTAASVGTTKTAGGAGGAGQIGGGATRGGGGGGGSGSAAANGGAGAAGSGGVGGNGGTGSATGGKGGNDNASGAIGNSPGAGGGGAGASAAGARGATGQIKITYITPPIAHYRFDEASWTGSDVIDSSTNAYTATKAGNANTASASSAYTSGSQSTCNYGRFDVTGTPNAYVQLPPAFPTLNSNFTIAAWIRTTNINKTGQRVFVRDDNSDGWALSVSDEVAGTLRLFNRSISYTPATVTGGGVLRAGNVALDTPVLITPGGSPVMVNNTWYYVAVTVDLTSKVITLYVYNTAGTQLAKTSASFTGTWAPGTGATSIGNETSLSGENGLYFSGNIDEVRVLSGSLTQTEVESYRTVVRTCPGTGFNHIRLEHDGQGITCQPESVKVRACADSNCASEYTGSVSTTLSPTGWVGGDAKTFSGGNATYSLSKTTTGTITLGAASTTPTTAVATRCFNGATETCSMDFVDAGFIFSSAANGSVLAVTPQTAGTAFGPVWLRAVKTNTTTLACESAVSTPTQNVSFDYDCANPSTCSSGSYMTMGSNSIGDTASTISLTFDANGNANLGNISYQDVGAISLKASATVGGVPLTGTLSASGGSPFVVKPAAFTLAPSTCADGTVNAVSQSAPAAGNAKFCRAGQNFTAKVTALNSAGNATPNFGRETTKESVALSAWGAHLPSPGANGTPPSATFTGTASAGTLTADAATTWNEVGILKATAAIADGDYLGGGNVSNTSYIGRFYPDHFDTTLTPPTGCAGFIYAGRGAAALGQTFTVTSKAMSAGVTPSVTTNYNNTGAFAKNVDLSLSAGGGVGKLYVGSTQTGNGAIPASAFAAGVGTVAFNAGANRISYSFDTFPTIPTGITLHGVDADTGTSLVASTDAGSTAYAGRLRLVNAYGSDLLPLRVPFLTEFYTATATWALNANDSCTALPTTAVALGNRNPATLGSNVTSVVPISSGAGTIVLGTPASAGVIDLAADLVGTASSTLAANSACLGAAWTNGPNATTGAGLDYLTSNWCTGSYTQLPAVRLRFGSPRAPYLYLRERY